MSRLGGARPLIVPGLLELAFLAASGWWPEAGVPFPRLLLLAGAFGAYVFAARAAVGAPAAGRVVWGFAVLFRAVLLPCAPFLSDDIYRYLWDGHVQLQGIDPYLYPPDAPELESIRTAWHARINNPSVPTVYPPFAQMVFLAGARVGGSPFALKALWTLADLAACALLGKVARRTGRSVPGTLVLFAWSPLLVVETAWSGHFESLGLLLLTVLLLLALPAREPGGEPVAVAAPRRWASWAMGGVLALAALTKFAPVAALPPLARRYGVRLAAACAVVLALFHLPHADAGSALWTGLSTYAEHWRAYEGAFAVLEAVLPGRPLAPRYLSAALVLAVVGWATLKRLDAEEALFRILGAGLLLSPTFHPWYALWILPFAALRRNRAWILLSGFAFVAYWGLGTHLETGDWPRPLWTRLFLWLPFYGLLLWDAARRSGTFEAAHPQAPVAQGEERQERGRGV